MVFLILEQHVYMKYIHIALYCDNIPTVSWVRYLSAKSAQAARLMHVLALHMEVNQISPIVSLSIAGWKNKEADFASRTFRDGQG